MSLFFDKKFKHLDWVIKYLWWVCWTSKFDLSWTTKYDQIHDDYCYKLGHLQLSGSNPIMGTARKALKMAQKKEFCPKTFFCRNVSIFWQKILTVTSFKTLRLGVKAQQAYLRWVRWTLKFDLSSKTKCDQIHSNDCFKLGHPLLGGSDPTTGTSRETLKMAQNKKRVPKNILNFGHI
jgi:hypothetical protein